MGFGENWMEWRRKPNQQQSEKKKNPQASNHRVQHTLASFSFTCTYTHIDSIVDHVERSTQEQKEWTIPQQSIGMQRWPMNEKINRRMKETAHKTRITTDQIILGFFPHSRALCLSPPGRFVGALLLLLLLYAVFASFSLSWQIYDYYDVFAFCKKEEHIHLSCESFVKPAICICKPHYNCQTAARITIILKSKREKNRGHCDKNVKLECNCQW